MEKKYDVIIIGTGVAGLYATLNFPNDVNVLLVSKRELPLSNSSLAQGGVACVLDTVHDSYKLHITDTLIAGKYKNNLSAVEKLVEEGPEDVLKISALGVDFEKIPTELYAKLLRQVTAATELFIIRTQQVRLLSTDLWRLSELFRMLR